MRHGSSFRQLDHAICSGRANPKHYLYLSIGLRLPTVSLILEASLNRFHCSIKHSSYSWPGLKAFLKKSNGSFQGEEGFQWFRLPRDRK